MPDNISCIYNLHNEEAIFSVYKERNIILEQLENYKIELIQDCNLEFGLIYQREGQLEEILVSNFKYLKVWGNNQLAFNILMKDFKLNEMINLNFIDEFPRVIEPLTRFNEKAKMSETIIEEFNNLFKV